MQLRTITDQFSVSGPVDEKTLKLLSEQGVGVLINVRPDHEELHQLSDSELEEMAEQAGLAYVYIPVKSGEYPAEKIAMFAKVLAFSNTAIHSVCRTGTRAAHMWALAQCKAGVSKTWLQSKLMEAGIDVAPLLANCEALTNKKAAA